MSTRPASQPRTPAPATSSTATGSTATTSWRAARRAATTSCTKAARRRRRTFFARTTATPTAARTPPRATRATTALSHRRRPRRRRRPARPSCRFPWRLRCLHRILQTLRLLPALTFVRSTPPAWLAGILCARSATTVYLLSHRPPPWHRRRCRRRRPPARLPRTLPAASGCRLSAAPMSTVRRTPRTPTPPNASTAGGSTVSHWRRAVRRAATTSCTTATQLHRRISHATIIGATIRADAWTAEITAHPGVHAFTRRRPRRRRLHRLLSRSQ